MKDWIRKLLEDAGGPALCEELLPKARDGRNGNYIAACPFHGDTNPHMTVHPGKMIYSCWVCGGTKEGSGTILTLFMLLKGLDFKAAVVELKKRAGHKDYKFPKNKISTPPPSPSSKNLTKKKNKTDNIKRTITHRCWYHLENGDRAYQKFKMVPGWDGFKKSFFYKHIEEKTGKLTGKGRYYKNLDGEWTVEALPFNLHLFAKTEMIFFCEGEKMAESITGQVGLGYEIVGTSLNDGAGSDWLPWYEKYFKNKIVFFLPDNDDPGRRFCLKLTKELLPVCKEVRVVTLPGLPEKGDVIDWLEAEKDNKNRFDDFMRLCLDTPPLGCNGLPMLSFLEAQKFYGLSKNTLKKRISDGIYNDKYSIKSNKKERRFVDNRGQDGSNDQNRRVNSDKTTGQYQESTGQNGQNDGSISRIDGSNDQNRRVNSDKTTGQYQESTGQNENLTSQNGQNDWSNDQNQRVNSGKTTGQSQESTGQNENLTSQNDENEYHDWTLKDVLQEEEYYISDIRGHKFINKKHFFTRQEEGDKKNRRGRFLPQKMAKYFLASEQTDDYQKHPGLNMDICTFGHWMYLYNKNKGIYENDGEHKIKLIIRRILGNDARGANIKEVLDAITDLTKVKDSNFFNKKWYLLGLKNCVIDIRTGQIFKHGPEHKLTVQLPVKYDPKATCPNFINFLLQRLPHDYLQLIFEVIGYCLFRHTRGRINGEVAGFNLEKWIILVGKKRTGKSTFLNVLQELIGYENRTSVSLTKLTDDKFGAAMAVDKLVIVNSDMELTRIPNTQVLNRIVSSDSMIAERKMYDPVEVRLGCTLLASANKLPPLGVLREEVEAAVDRTIIIDFPFTLPKEQRINNYEDCMTTPEELSGMLNMALIAARGLIKRRDFTVPECAEELLKEKVCDFDSVAAFIRECCVQSEAGSSSRRQLWHAYVYYCMNEGKPRETVVGRNSFYKEVESFKEIEKNGDMFNGLVLVKISDEDIQSNQDEINNYIKGKQSQKAYSYSVN